MTLPASGPLTFAQIQTEFGGTNPIGLNEYYRGGIYVSSGIPQNANVPTSGAISLSNFYGAQKAFTFTSTIASNTTNYNLSTAMTAAGWNGTDPVVATVTINGGVSVLSNNTGTPAFTVSSLPTGSAVSITNNGFIYGAGGAAGFAPGGAGGVGLSVSHPTTVTNNGFITGGGGAGGAGADLPSTNCTSNISTVGGGGGSAIQIFANLTMFNASGIYGGGGGGGGGGQSFVGSGCGVTISASGGGGGGGQSYGGGAGAPRGCFLICSANPGFSAAIDGSAGSSGGGGAGGAGGFNNGVFGGAGGNGGTWATGGAAGGIGSAGGAGGRAVTLSGGAFTLASNTGTILGAYT
jgi:hypothetical protein